MNENTIYVFTDGSCLGNPGPGGFGAIVRDLSGRDFEFSGTEYNSTNNRMEIAAVIEAFRFLNLHKVSERTILVQTDSKLVVNTYTLGWKKKANQDLWKALDLEVFYLQNRRNDLQWAWIKGHAGHIENERCDVLARTAASQIA
jgi:ribonuclease HI